QYAPRPVIVCGDFNDTPKSRTVTLMKERFIDSWEISGAGPGFSFPADTPKQRIDYVFLSKNTVQHQKAFLMLRPVSARVLQTDASDHLPVLVELELNTSN
ncbi:MAG: endonuclease/exonuclease/phosphatase family protein, partial [Ignavibacteriales bacterium]|nr:endonuclease/exonuclease/phosphatase family protein [Ignavibacteriales bacterium]